MADLRLASYMWLLSLLDADRALFKELKFTYYIIIILNFNFMDLNVSNFIKLLIMYLYLFCIWLLELLYLSMWLVNLLMLATLAI
jgi:hypothetical protein